MGKTSKQSNNINTKTAKATKETKDKIVVSDEVIFFEGGRGKQSLGPRIVRGRLYGAVPKGNNGQGAVVAGTFVTLNGKKVKALIVKQKDGASEAPQGFLLLSKDCKDWFGYKEDTKVELKKVEDAYIRK